METTIQGTPSEMVWREAVTVIDTTNGDAEKVKANDKARHRLIDIATESNSGKKWRTILAKFRASIPDLRPGVIKRAVRECPDGLRPDFELLQFRIETNSLIENQESWQRTKGLWKMIEGVEKGIFTWSEVISIMVENPTALRLNLCQRLQATVSPEDWAIFLLRFCRETTSYLEDRNKEYETSDVALMHLLVELKGAREADVLFRELGRLPRSVYERIRLVLKPTAVEKLQQDGWKVTEENDSRVVLTKDHGGWEETKTVQLSTQSENGQQKHRVV